MTAFYQHALPDSEWVIEAKTSALPSRVPGTAGVYIGGNSQEQVLLIEAPDGMRVGRTWSRATGQHQRTLNLGSPSSSGGDSYNMLSIGSAQTGGNTPPATVTNLPNGARQVQSGDLSWTTSWCSSSFCS